MRRRHRNGGYIEGLPVRDITEFRARKFEFTRNDCSCWKLSLNMSGQSLIIRSSPECKILRWKMVYLQPILQTAHHGDQVLQRGGFDQELARPQIKCALHVLGPQGGRQDDHGQASERCL